jgi:hypothetical protein
MSKGIFINYRRDDSAGMAGRLFDSLSAHFGSDTVFIDVDQIPAGLNFVNFLEKQIASSEAMLVIVGPKWLSAVDEVGRPRLENANDFVRVELQAALEHDIPTIPILVEGAAMPRGDQLPAAIRDLALRQALEIRHATFRTDVARVIKGIEQLGIRGIEQLGSSSGLTQKKDDQEEYQPREGEFEKSFIANFAQARQSGSELAKLMEAIELRNVSLIDESPSIQGVEEHLKFFPIGQSRPLAFARLEYLFWDEIRGTSEPKLFSDYLRRFPNGSHIEEAKRRRDQLLSEKGVNPDAGPRIFLNYRRLDSQDSADRIYEALSKWLPAKNILMDVDRKSLIPGLPVRKQLVDLVSSCNLMLVLINNKWVDELTRRSIRHEKGEDLDFVRTEIVAALEKGDSMPIVPVLLGETATPIAKDLPPDVSHLMERSAVRLTRENFSSDLQLLIEQTTRFLDGKYKA